MSTLNEETLESLAKAKNLSYIHYNNQAKMLRKLAIKKLGAEKVAVMTEDEVISYFKDKQKLLPMVISLGYGNSYIEEVFLIPISELSKFEVLSR